MRSLNANLVREKNPWLPRWIAGWVSWSNIALFAVHVIFLCMRYMLNFQETFQVYINYCCIVAVSIFFSTVVPKCLLIRFNIKYYLWSARYCRSALPGIYSLFNWLITIWERYERENNYDNKFNSDPTRANGNSRTTSLRMDRGWFWFKNQNQR